MKSYLCGGCPLRNRRPLRWSSENVARHAEKTEAAPTTSSKRMSERKLDITPKQVEPAETKISDSTRAEVFFQISYPSCPLSCAHSFMPLKRPALGQHGSASLKELSQLTSVL
jgi:hypothetical protein